MMRVTTLYASSAVSSAAYYTKYLTAAPGEAPGAWMGAQADALGLVGNVDEVQLQALLAGLDPVTGRSLGRALSDRTTADGRVVKAVAGFDATLSAPKSLSVLWALTGDDRLLECHDVAVRAVVESLERWAATTRVRSNGGRLHLDTLGLSVAGFRQTTSRKDDPQIHTHLVISAKVQTVDGRWLALDARVLKQHQRSFGGLYQSVLRSELTARFGVGWEPIVNGQAEIAGIDPDLLAAFSKRAAQVDVETNARVEEFEAREGRAPSRFERAAIERRAAADTRVKKTGTAAAELRTMWRQEAADLGHTPRSVIDAMRARSIDVHTPVKTGVNTHVRTGVNNAVNTPADANVDAAPKITVAEIVSALSDRRSVWHDLDVLREITDRFRPRRGIPGERWAGVLDRALSSVLDACVGLDPEPVTPATTDKGAGGARGSDGRSVWIEPVAPRWSSQLVIDQELDLLAWTLAAQGGEPSPSTTIERGDLDVMQAAAAGEVAGRDRLVVIIGPAGAGKTSMLTAAVDDLVMQRRQVFGVAPTARAARVLETETGMRCDTLAKLLHEHTREGGPRPEWRLAVGATVIVDEAGMVSTPDLWRLTDLARRLELRVVLVGDPYQLQAVARGGMFPELAATATRTVELEQVHRFNEPWEAGASLRLRQGDPDVLAVYQRDGRVVPGSLDDHLDKIGRAWTGAHTAGRSLAITTTTNEHATLINHHIQHTRLKAGALTGEPVAAADGEVLVGDVVMTRRNDRTLTTTTGDTVRNRDRWTVTATHEDGSITARSHVGEATVDLPAVYVCEFVQLAYATTEHGNQGITTDTSITLVTGTTTGRGLYVGATRGRHDNQLLVVTDQHSEPEALEVLQRVLATDRADLPAVTHRRRLAERTPVAAPAAVPVPVQRCRVVEPGWVNDWHSEVRARIPAINGLLDTMTSERPALEHAVATSRASYGRACALPGPDQHDRFQARRQANLDANAAAVARDRARNATWRTRRTLERAATRAAEHAAISGRHADHLDAVHQPIAEHAEAARVAHAKALARLDTHDQRALELRRYRADDTALDHAITTWRTWAAGHPVLGADLRSASEALARHADTVPEARALLTTLNPEHPALHQHVRQIGRADLDHGIEL
ncbi:MAG: MobF family relaxase [Acidimicrobiales bacterium]